MQNGKCIVQVYDGSNAHTVCTHTHKFNKHRNTSATFLTQLRLICNTSLTSTQYFRLQT